MLGGHRTTAETIALTAADGVPLAASLLPGPSATGAGVVLAHGFAAHRRKPAYARLADGLAVRFTVLSLDLRGHGSSGGACTLGDREALDVAAAVDGLRRRGHGPLAAIGVSMGGTAVMHALATRDLGIAAAVVVSSPARLGRVETEPLAFLDGVWRTPWKRRALELVSGVRLVGPERWAGMDHPERLAARVAAPLLVVHGADDHFFPLEDAHALARASRGEAVVWVEPPGFGHAEDGLSRRFARRVGRALEIAFATGSFPPRRELARDPR